MHRFRLKTKLKRFWLLAAKLFPHGRRWRKYRRYHRTFAFIGLLVIIVLLPLSIYRLRQASKTAAWFDDDYKYRQKVTVSNVGNIQQNYQYAITLDTSTLITAGKLRSDCADLRLTTVTGEPISYPNWIENCNTTTTRILVKFTSVPTETQTYYLYYGNPEHSTLNQPDYFYTLEDNFTGSTITPGRFTSGGGTISQNNELSMVNNGDAWDLYFYTSSTYTRHAGDFYTAKVKADSGTRAMIGWHDGGAGVSYSDLVYAIYFNNGTFMIYEDGTQRTTDSGSYSSNTWYDTKIVLKSTGATYYYKPVTSDTWIQLYDSSYSSEATLRWGAVHHDVTEKSYYDDLYLWVAPASQPTITLGSQEISERPLAYWKFDEGYNGTHDFKINKHEQYINIYNGYYSQQSNSWLPTDNSLGLVYWDADMYPNSTVYLEVMYYESNLSQPGIGIFSESGSAAGTWTLADTNGWTFNRVGPITLQDNTKYTVRMYSNDFFGNVYTNYLRSARLVVVQNSDAGLHATQTQIELGDQINMSTASATVVNKPKYYEYDPTQFRPQPTAHIESTLINTQPTIEQHIPILNHSFNNTYRWSYTPDDNSLGIVKWDGSKYSSDTVYLEAIVRCTGGYVAGVGYNMGLFKTDGTAGYTTGVSCPSTWGRWRSGSFSLTDGQSYTLRTQADNAYGWPIEVKSARLVVVQSNSAKITDTQTTIEVGASQLGFTNTEYAELDDPKYYLYDHGKFSPTPESTGDVEFHASLKIADAGDTVYAELINKTHGTTLAELSHTGNTSWTLKTITNVDGNSDWDTTNDDQYAIRIRCNDDNGGGCAGSIENAKIILSQSDANGITDLEIIHQYDNDLSTDTDNSYTSTNNFSYYNQALQVSSVNFAGAFFSFNLDAVMKTTANTALVELYDFSNGVSIAGSETTTTATSYTQVRSQELANNLPKWPARTAAVNLGTRIKNSEASGNTTSISSSSLVITVDNLPTNGVTSYVDLYNVTDGTPVSGSQISTTETSWKLKQSSPFTLPSATKEYALRMWSSNGGIAKMLNGKLVLSQSSSTTGVSKTQTVHPFITQADSLTNTNYTDRTYLSQFDRSRAASIPPNLTTYFETTMKTTNGTAFAQLRNVSDASTLTGSEVTTTSTDFVRTRNPISLFNLPAATKNFDAQTKNTAGGTVTVNSAALVLTNNASVIPAYESENGYHAGLYNPSWIQEADCISGKCLQFDDSTQFAALQTNAPFNFSISNSFTISGWFYPLTNSGVLMAKHDAASGSDGGYKVYLENGYLKAGFDTNNTSFPEDSVTSNVVTTHSWHHFAVVKQGTSRIDLYVDGVLVNSDTNLASSGTYSNTDPLYFGIDGDFQSNPFNGRIDEFKVYPYALTRDKVMFEFSKGDTLGTSVKPSITRGLIGHWKLNESASPAIDSSISHNDAVWSGDISSSRGIQDDALRFDGNADLVTPNSGTNIPGVPLQLPEWSVRKPIRITNSNTSALTNYQIQLTINHQSSMQPDFDDIRFTNAAGTDLDYWIESKTDGVSAVVWVEVDSLAASQDTNIYLYYGNPSAVSTSNGANTFIFFDNFDGSAVDTSKWTVVDGTGISVANGFLSATSTTGWLESKTTFDKSQNVIAETKVQTLGTPTSGYNPLSFWASTSNSWGGLIHPGSPFQLYHRSNSTWTSIYNSTTVSNLLVRLVAKSNNTADIYYINTDTGNTVISATNIANAVDNEPIRFIRREDNANTGESMSARWDYVRVRKYASVMPTAVFDNSKLHSLSVSVWINPTTLDSTNRVVIARGNSGSYAWSIYNDAANPGHLKYTTDGSVFGVSTTTLTAESWHHLSLVRDEGITRFYVNGRLDSQVVNTGMLSRIGTVSIGADPDGTDGWHGLIDDVRIYNRSLTDNEISQLSQNNPGPEAFYDFNENTGTTAYDKSGNNYAMTITNALWTTGKYGSGLHFNGTSDFLTRSDTEAFDVIADQSMTLEAWFKHGTTVVGQDTILAKGNMSTGSDGGYSLYMNNDGSITCAYDRDNTSFPEDSATSTTFYADNQWHHVLCIKDAANSITLYVDNIKAGSDISIASTGTYANTDPLYIGIDMDGTSNPWEGELDEVKIYNYAISPPDRIIAMNATHPIGGSPVGSSLTYWKFDEGTGKYAYDSYGNDQAMWLGGGNACPGAYCPNWTASGKYGSALSFDGNDYVESIDSSAFAIYGSQPVSVSVWVNTSSKPVGSSYYGVIGFASQYGGGSQDKFIQINQSGRPNFYTWNGSSEIHAVGTTDVTDGQWHHLVGVFTGTESYIYVDGRKEGAVTTTSTDNVSSPQVILSYYHSGAPSYYEHYTGLMDEAKVYNFALTPDQVVGDYNRGNAVALGVQTSTAAEYCVPGDSSPCLEPVGHWKLDENSGIQANDTSGNNRTGTLTNSPTWVPGKVGNAVSFNGSNAYVDIGTGPATVRTVAFWAYPQTTTEYFINLTNSDYIWANSGTLTAEGFTNPTIYVNGLPSTTIEAQKWQHITITSSTAENASNLDLGRTQDTNYLQGRLDEVRLYDYVRTPAQIAWDYNKGAPLAYWKLDECTGTTVNSSVIPNITGTISPGVSGNTAAGSCNSGTDTDMWNDGTTGKFESGLGFDGSDDAVTVSDTAAIRFDAATQDFSMFGWIKRDPGYAYGGTVTDVNGYRIHTFRSSGTLQVNKAMNVEVLVVGGGGGGGMDMGGGGGGGGVVYNAAYAVNPGAITVTVGNGGTGAPAAGTNGQPGAHQFTIGAQSGQNSVFDSITAIGGGYGGSSVYTHALAGTPGSGGSGGGASGYSDTTIKAGGTGTAGQGYNGGRGGGQYYSGGGGGAGGPGTDSTAIAHGGPGVLNSILGVPYYWGGGGGGSGYTICGGNGGIGGGGGGAVCTTTGGVGLNNGSPGGGGTTVAQTNTPGGNAGANTGGGGGGGSHYSSNNKGGDGGSGIVIVKYPISFADSQAEVLVSKEDADNDGYRVVINTDDTITCSVNSIDITSTATISDNGWHHIGCTIDRNGYGQVYIDGRPSGSPVAINNEAMNTTANLTFVVRSFDTSNPFNGSLDDLRLYPYAATPTQIKTIMTGGAVRFE